MKDVISTECVVIGGGIVGLAIASELAKKGKKIILLEKENLSVKLNLDWW